MTESTKDPWLHRSKLSSPINQSGDGTNFVITEIWNILSFRIYILLTRIDRSDHAESPRKPSGHLLEIKTIRWTQSNSLYSFSYQQTFKTHPVFILTVLVLSPVKSSLLSDMKWMNKLSVLASLFSPTDHFVWLQFLSKISVVPGYPVGVSRLHTKSYTF